MNGRRRAPSPAVDGSAAARRGPSKRPRPGAPCGPQGASAAALHVDDGSQIVSGRRVLTVVVDGERYGSCLARLTPARLADGYLPILETAYRTRIGARYEQESFVARSPALVSF